MSIMWPKVAILKSTWMT